MPAWQSGQGLRYLRRSHRGILRYTNQPTAHPEEDRIRNADDPEPDRDHRALQDADQKAAAEEVGEHFTDLVTDAAPPEPFAAALKDAGVKVHITSRRGGKKKKKGSGGVIT